MTLRRSFVAVVVTGAVLPAAASADALLYRCGSDVCRVAPNGTAKQRLTKGAHVTWLSASTDGSRVGVVDATFAYVLDAKGRLLGPALSPDGTLVAVASATDVDRGSGEIIVYDVASAKPASSLGGARDREPTWSPDMRRIAFERDGEIFVVRFNKLGGGRLLRGRQPVWTTAPACHARPRVRARGRKAIVTACAPQPGRLTVTLRRNGERAARKTVRAATGGLVKVRFSRPAGRLSAKARLRQRAATLR
jgi:hypothetical protein